MLNQRTRRAASADGAPESAPFEVSNDLLGDPAGLRARLRADGYLFIKGCLSAGNVRDVRRAALKSLAQLGWLASPDSPVPADGFARYPGDPAYWAGIEAMLRSPSLYALRHDDGLQALLGDLFGMPFFSHPRTVARIAFPSGAEGFYESPAHQDYPYGQGGLDTLTAWIPLGDCTVLDGSLEIMAGSHHAGLREIFGGTDYRCAATEVDVVSPDWRGGDLAAGDVLVFTSLTVHRARPNRAANVRLSLDCRFQPVASPLCSSALEPAFHPRVPDWPELLDEDSRAAVTRLPDGVVVVPAVPPEQVRAPAGCLAFEWLAGSAPETPMPKGEHR